MRIFTPSDFTAFRYKRFDGAIVVKQGSAPKVTPSDSPTKSNGDGSMHIAINRK